MDEIERNDRLRLNIYEIKLSLLDSSVTLKPKEVLERSIKLLSLMVEAQLSPDYHLDPIFMCCEASKALGNDRALSHWSEKGAQISATTRGLLSRNTAYFTSFRKK